MKNFYKITFFIASIFCISFFSIQEANTKSNGSPLANTGSPGDGSNNTCAKGGCHVGTPNTHGGNISIDVNDVPATGYAPGTTYNIGVTVTESGRSTFGFQITAENGSGSKRGSYSANTGTRVEMTNWATHSMNSGTGSWNVLWTAPQSTDDITFYGAGNAANSDGTSNGDHIYTGSSVTISRDLIASVEGIAQNQNIEVINPFGEKRIMIKAQGQCNFVLYNISGNQAGQFHTIRGTEEIDLNHLEAGQYILREVNAGFTKRLMLR